MEIITVTFEILILNLEQENVDAYNEPLMSIEILLLRFQKIMKIYTSFHNEGKWEEDFRK